LKIYPEGAAQKNNHGNLPLHYAAHYNAPLEVVEALYHAYPEGAMQKNNDNNTPLDLAIADGASANVVALLQGQTVPPTDEEMLAAAKARCERMEKELQRSMEQHDGMNEDREVVLNMLMDIKDKHPHALYSAGIDPKAVSDMESLLGQVRRSANFFLCFDIYIYSGLVRPLNMFDLRFVSMVVTGKKGEHRRNASPGY